MTTGKTIALTIWTFVSKEMSLLFTTLSRLVIAFLARSKSLLISWLQLLSAGIWEPKKIKSVTVSIVSPSIWHEVMGPDAMISVFWMLSFKPAFSLPSFPFTKGLFSSSSVSANRLLSSVYLTLLIFLLVSFQLFASWLFSMSFLRALVMFFVQNAQRQLVLPKCSDSQVHTGQRVPPSSHESFMGPPESQPRLVVCEDCAAFSPWKGACLCEGPHPPRKVLGRCCCVTLLTHRAFLQVADGGSGFRTAQGKSWLWDPIPKWIKHF